MYAKSVNAKARAVEAVLSSETIDGHGEIVDQASWNLDRYRKNPIVLRSHDFNSVVGHAEAVRVEDGKLQARVIFASTPLADETFQLFVDQAMRAFSVGFRPGRIASESLADGRSVRRLLDCELFEVSAVSIPSNPDAVAKFKSLGLVPAQFELRDAGAEISAAAYRKAVGDLAERPSSGDASFDISSSAMGRAERALGLR